MQLQFVRAGVFLCTQMNLFHQAKHQTVEQLEIVQGLLVRCVAEGMQDLDDSYYNELLGLIDEAKLAESWPDLKDVIEKAKTLEIDIAAWLSRMGRTTTSLDWPFSIES
ncbi:MAG: hypothetical protein HY324_03770 [Chlamydiia bacterium]|nr:hypothetical protein [Chlamydiia bacterium]